MPPCDAPRRWSPTSRRWHTTSPPAAPSSTTRSTAPSFAPPPPAGLKFHESRRSGGRWRCSVVVLEALPPRIGDRALLEEQTMLRARERHLVVGREPASLNDLARAGRARGVVATVAAHGHALYGTTSGRAPCRHRRRRRWHGRGDCGATPARRPRHRGAREGRLHELLRVRHPVS